MPDRRIDFSDIPESTDLELKRARPVGRPRSGEAKRLIAIRIHPRVLATGLGAATVKTPWNGVERASQPGTWSPKGPSARAQERSWWPGARALGRQSKRG